MNNEELEARVDEAIEDVIIDEENQLANEELQDFAEEEKEDE